MSLSDYRENKILDHEFKTATYTQETNLYVALFTAAPSDSGGGTEVTGGSYARVIHNTWDAAVAGATENTGAITFPAATANWGTVTHFGIFDASTAGNLLRWGALTASQAVNSGNTAEFADGALDATID